MAKKKKQQKVSKKKELKKIKSKKKNNTRIKQLEKKLSKKMEYISHLERVNDAHGQVEELSRNELLDADKTIKAQETVQDMMQRERVDADKIIQAQEIVQEMMAKEKIDADDIIKAHERVQDLMAREKRLADDTIRAHENVEHLALEEQLQAERTIKAFEQMGALSTLEKQEAEQIIRARERLSTLTINELKQKDDALRNILDVNNYISSFLDEEILLQKVLNSLVSSLHAKRGVLFIDENNSILPKIFYKIKKSDLQKKDFLVSAKVIDEAITSRKSRIIINQEIKKGRSTTNLSLIAVPLIYESNLLGVLYVDIISKTDTFKHFDLELAEIFSSQAAISVHNSMMYEKIRNQNMELLRLNNLKNQFITHVSDKLSMPIQSIKTLWAKLSSKTELDITERNKLLTIIKSRLDNIDVTVSKVITIIALEAEVDELFADAVNFNTTVNEVIEKHKLEAIERKLTINVDLPSQFNKYYANFALIKTIFDELISNAIFYNKSGGTVDIKGYRKGGHLAIDITDTGYGIKNKDVDQIFNQFFRAEESIERNEWGAGLGLFMVHTFISYYNGEVVVQTEEGKGSTFTITFLMQ